MRPTPDQISAATQWARANDRNYLHERYHGDINWAALAEGMLTAALGTGEPEVVYVIEDTYTVRDAAKV